MADYGFTCMWLNNDWQGADFIAIHADGITSLKVQLKGRLSFCQKYRGKNIYIAFISGGELYLYPHDEILDQIENKISDKTWLAKGTWSTPYPTSEQRNILQKYKL